jgi:predicted nucleic acid-binding protein
MMAELRPRIMGPRQLTDALLLDLAIRNDGVLATLDRRISHLLPPGSSNRKHLEVIPVD